MQTPSTFQIYNASAGSGKTFTLVKEYLKILLSTEDMYIFQRILAITFTNKAAAEMKDRVLKNLKEFSEGNKNAISEILLEETTIDQETLIKRSKRVLHAILQNYSAFHITTIDSFTYKIIKSFAFDLGLTQNFEVEMDAKDLLNEAVELLISQIGSDQDLTRVLIDYSMEKTEEDKSWNIAFDLTEFSKILLNENDAEYFKNLSNRSIQDFLALKHQAIAENSKIEEGLYEIGKEALNLIQSHDINLSQFSYSGECPNHFNKLTRIKILRPSDFNFEGRLNSSFENDKALYAKKADELTKEKIDFMYPELKELFFESKRIYQSNYKQYWINRLVLQSIIPLTVLNNINQELENLKEENNLRLNSEFNQLISENIQEQPAPYIYERIGQKFMHYFIDEMQDTSVLQWQNLIPLINNSLSQEGTSLLLVGDGKQAIYRWRGGKAEQFIELGSEKNESANPFFIPKEVKELETNYRSYSEIIRFNNSLFQHISEHIHKPEYKALFAEHSFQNPTNKEGGFVSISFVEKEENSDENELRYAKKVKTILNHLDTDIRKGDVCVLVRRKKEGVLIANYLSEQGIEIVSSETLLLQNSKKVQFIVDVLRYSLFSNDQNSLFELLTFAYELLEVDISRHDFYKNHVDLSIQELFQSFQSFGCSFELNHYHQLPLYEKVEHIIRSFHMLKKPDVYVQFFLDEVLSMQRREASIQDLLEYWDLKKENLSVITSDNPDAVKIMTIHKSKGLEFPVVIFPCDLDVYKELEPKAWIRTHDNFPEILVRLNKDIAQIHDQGEAIYQQRQEELELDNFNLLYVALTRAVEQLYVVTDKNLNKSGQENIKFYSGMFISYLKKNGLWDEEKNDYHFGNSQKLSQEKTFEKTSQELQEFLSHPWQEHNIKLLASSSKLWGTARGMAINYGDLIHEMMSRVFVKQDVDPVVEYYHAAGILTEEQAKKVRSKMTQIVDHPKLQNYFTKRFTIYNEREIISAEGRVVIPDRLTIDHNNHCFIIDYKTGAQHASYKDQVEYYAHVLESLGFPVQKKILVYLNENILVEDF